MFTNLLTHLTFSLTILITNNDPVKGQAAQDKSQFKDDTAFQVRK